MNTFMNGLKNFDNMTYTENGAAALKSTGSAVYDMFAVGASYRNRSDEDIILLFKNALEENESLALKCLFYIRDIRSGQGERRFFRVAYKWLANTYPTIAERNLNQLSEYGRWDDLVYICIDTPLENKAMKIIRDQVNLDLESTTPSLLSKWLPSENASSEDTKRAAHIVRKHLGLTSKQYRKVLSELRGRINVLERLMSAGRWSEIEFDKIPSKAGLVYKNAFARRDIIAAKYEAFAKDKSTKVNAGALYPYEIVAKAVNYFGGYYGRGKNDATDRAMIEKYWESLPDYFKDNEGAKMICVVDTSGSMTGYDAAAPINVAISLGMYCAERLTGPFKNHYISFASRPQLIDTTQGVDFVDRVRRIYETNLCDNTNLEAVFDLLLQIAQQPGTKKEDIPTQVVVMSDMQIDSMTGPSYRHRGASHRWTEETASTEMEKIKAKWAAAGFQCPSITYWNLDARGDANIIDKGPGVSFVSGFSPVIMKQILSGKSGMDLCLETLMSDRYKAIA